MIKTAGRTDLDNLFEKSSVLDGRLSHTPFLVFVETAEGVQVEVVDRADKLLGHPDETKAMVQWPGQWRSDWFQLTVGDVRAVLARRRGGRL